MIEFKTLQIITENIPSHFWNTYYNLPIEVRLIWLKRFIKKQITIQDFYQFVSSKNYYSNLEEYKKSEHFLILRDVLGGDFEKYDWFCRQTAFYHNTNKTIIERDINIWLIQRV